MPLNSIGSMARMDRLFTDVCMHGCRLLMTLKACELVLTASANVIGAKMLTKSISETIHGVSGHEIYVLAHNVVFSFCERAP